MPEYYSFVVSAVFWFGLAYSMVMTSWDLVWVGEAEREKSGRRVLQRANSLLSIDPEAGEHYVVRLVGSVWRNLTGGPVSLFTFGWISPTFLALLLYAGLIS